MWESKVIYKNQSDNGGVGRILVQHDAHVGVKGVYKGFNADVTAIENDQITLFYNKSRNPLGAQILLFDITLLEIAE
jgi:hypothetical protein